MIDYESHLRELRLVYCSHAHKLLVVHHGLQLVVLSQPQLQLVAVGAVREQWHVAMSRSVRLYTQVDGHILAAEVALGLSLHAGLVSKLHTYCLRQVIVVHLALHLKVGYLAQTVVLNVLREVENYIITSVQYAALWFGLTEHLRTTCVLDTADNLRRCGEEVVTIAAEQYGAQIVSTLNHCAFTVELGYDVSVLLHQSSHAVGIGHERRVSIERAEVHPGILATLRLLVLELDVVEVVLVSVKSVDGHRYVPSTLLVGILLCVGVQYPLVARHRDIHRSGLTQEVYVERCVLHGVIRIGRRHDA